MDGNVLTEIIPLSDKDCFHIVDRYKDGLTFPIHQHKAYELNFIQHAKGARRIVGDSAEVIGDYDLVLVASPDLEHTWEQGDCSSSNIREITIQFDHDLFQNQLLEKNQFSPIKDMLDQAHHGLVFPVDAIMSVYPILDSLSKETEKFIQYIKFQYVLYKLAVTPGSRILASSSLATSDKHNEGDRVMTVKQYIRENYKRTINLNEISALVNMVPSAFSRFFKTKTGTTVSDFIIDVRLTNATRLLVDTDMNIADICIECGFNNLSNFNRIFKMKRGLTPRAFRSVYRKKKVMV